MLIIGPDAFISQSSRDHSPLPRIDFSYYEISGPDICSLICGLRRGLYYIALGNPQVPYIGQRPTFKGRDQGDCREETQRAFWAVRPVLKKRLLFHIFMGKNLISKFFLHCSVHTKKLLKVKVKNLRKKLGSIFF